MRSRERRPWKVFVRDVGPTFSFARPEDAHARAAGLVEGEYADVIVFGTDDPIAPLATMRRTRYRPGVAPVEEHLVDGQWTVLPPMRWYHGTPARLDVGTVLLPGSQIGKATWDYGSTRAPRTDDQDHVWIASAIESCIVNVGARADDGTFRIYEVEPAGTPVREDGSPHSASFMCDSATIVRLILEFDDNGEVLYEAPDD